MLPKYRQLNQTTYLPRPGYGWTKIPLPRVKSSEIRTINVSTIA